MKKIVIPFMLIIIFSLTACQSFEVVSISEKQTTVSNIRNYILTQSIYNLETSSYEKLSTSEIMGDAFDYLDLQKNELPYLNSNLNKFTEQIHLSFINSLFEIQQILITYSEKLEYPLVYPNVDNKYIITEKSSTILFEQFRDELYSEIDEVLDRNLTEVSALYTKMAKEYNIYCQGLENLNRQSPPKISTNIQPRIKTVFIKVLINKLAENEINLGILDTPIDPTTITIK